MKFFIQFSVDNQAFEGQFDRDQEIARILKDLAIRCQDGWSEGSIKDVNGNTIGKYGFLVAKH